MECACSPYTCSYDHEWETFHPLVVMLSMSGLYLVSFMIWDFFRESITTICKFYELYHDFGVEVFGEGWDIGGL